MLHAILCMKRTKIDAVEGVLCPLGILPMNWEIHR